MGVQRVANEAGGVGIKRVRDRLAEFVREKLGDLVFETFAGFVRERQIVRVRAGPKDVRIDQFDRAFRILRARAARKRHTDQREKRDGDRLSRARHSHPPMHFVSACSNSGGLSSCLGGLPRGIAS